MSNPSRTERLNVGFVCANGVPPRYWTSVPNVVQHTTRGLTDRFDVTVVSDSVGRKPEDEIPGIHYVPIRSRWDRKLLDPVSDRYYAARRRDTQAFLRPGYHWLFAQRSTLALHRAHCDVAISVHFPQWLRPFERFMKQTKRVVWAHSADPAAPTTELQRDIEHLDAVIGCSQFVADYFVQRFPSLAGRAHVVHNGFDPELFRYAPRDPIAPPRVVFVGSLSPVKGVHVLVDAFRALAEEWPDLELHLAGPFGWGVASQLPLVSDSQVQEAHAIESTYRNELERRAGGALDRMHIHGPLHGTELAALFQSATVYVQPTIYNEGLPLPVLEAQACGAPCVVTRSGGMPEVVEEGVTGYVVPAGDPAAIAARVSSLLGDSETRARMGDLASRRAHARFTWKHIADEMHDVVSTIAHDRHRSRVRGESGKATSAGNG